jgi:hypothetical protein
MKTERDFKRLEAENRRLRQCLTKILGTLSRLAQDGDTINIRARDRIERIRLTLSPDKEPTP